MEPAEVAVGASFGLGLFTILLFFGIGVLGTIFWIWMLIDCATKETGKGSDKIVWVIIILVTHLLGAAIYFFARRPKRIAEQKK
ncbi:PLDc_N domain-containing protein [bacterium]|nr:PLDc_N domain-containing protein [bacterium]